MSCGMSDTATVLLERWEATISVVRESSSFWLNFSLIFPRVPDRRVRPAQDMEILPVGKGYFDGSKKGASSVSAADLELDITDEVCPMTFVRTKLALERMAVGQTVNIKLRDGEPRHNVPRAVKDHGHEVLWLAPLAGDLFELVVRKAR